MHKIDDIYKSIMPKTVEDVFVESQSKASLKTQTEPELILQDISEEELKQISHTAIVTEYKDGGVKSTVVDEICQEKYRSINYRECPLTVYPNINGLVGSRAFWQDSRGFGNGLYNICGKESKVHTLRPVLSPTKLLNASGSSQRLSNGPAPISLMAQYLYEQMEIPTMMEATLQSTGSNNVDCDRGWQSLNVVEGKKAASSGHRDGKKKRLGSCVMGFLRRLCCCVGKNGEE